MISPRLRVFISLVILFVWLVANFILYRLVGMPGLGGRYLALPFLVFLLSIFVAARYIQSAFGIERFSRAVRFLLTCLFGLDYPDLIISDGKAKVGAGSDSLILKVGGPGYLKIQDGNVAVVENYNGELRVLAPRKHFITRQETIKESISLEERYRLIEKLSAHSKDGIEVTAQEIRYRYRVCSESDQNNSVPPYGSPAENQGLPFQYSEQAILKMVYNRTQSSAGIGSWEEGVNSIVESIILDFIRSHPVDYLTAPISQGSDPRAEINAEFSSVSGRNRFYERGAELIWIDIGHFETPEKVVEDQRVSAWQARWVGNANIMRDYADAQEFGRAEAQSEFVSTIVQSLKSVGSAGESRQKIRAQYLARIHQIVESMKE